MSFGYTAPVQIISDALTYASAHETILIAAAGNEGGTVIVTRSKNNITI